ncbi:MAG: hypothetical protein IJG13_20180 [Kiritimatiellae bacterium]|nr:hypothetical protein [Kiritimatiellia bacterium]MBQ3343030.1 hypothetical protein [Kiritimatiellia bacterium]
MEKSVFALVCVACTGFAPLPELETVFTAAQLEKGAPKLDWTRNVDGSESTVVSEKAGGLDLKGVKLTRRVFGDGIRREVAYTLENATDGLRYASFGWRSQFSVAGVDDRNWFPTTDNVLDLTQQSSLWGYYSKPGNWQFSLVEPWFAAYNPSARRGFAFVFDYATLSAAYGANDMKTRGVMFDGGMLPPGKSITVKTTILSLSGLGSLATVNEQFAAGFTGPATAPMLEVLPFSDMTVEGVMSQTDVEGRVLGTQKVSASVKAWKPTTLGAVKSAKPATQTVLAAELNGLKFESFRENGFRMASLPLVPPVWTHHRPLPKKALVGVSEMSQTAKDKALLVFGFYANFFRFDEMFPELKFTTVSATPQGIADIPPASTIGEYKYVFLGDVNEESVRPMLARLSAYVRNGGTLVVGGGPFAYGCGGYAGTFLEEMLPVSTRAFDCLPACAEDRDGRTAVAFDGCDARLFWIQKDAVKPGAKVLLKTVTGDPLLVKGTYGRGRVFAFLGAPIGDEDRDAKAFWNGNADYVKTMRSLLK